ncbi:hypothetical protein ACJIZ3_010786 [Penstemon smallii]|uniref:Uncharacterized protein n=1 Tax=Penstemon smallii TaxID=265156 RepID=A0ABD3UHB2_9LAMI
MSVFQFPDHQVWNNAAFDNGDSEGFNAARNSMTSSLDSVSGKENQGPLLENQIPSVSSTITPLKSINRDGDGEKSRIKGVLDKGFPKENKVLEKKEFRDEKIIDKEIQEIESEISRLKLRLEGLRIEKAERNVKVVEKRGKIVSSKFMEQKESAKKKIEENSSLSAGTKVQRRGLSLGPAEIVSVGRRGISMGPSEIYGAVKSKQFTTPAQNRRKSCFMKLQDIQEEKEKGKSLSLSPKSRKLATRNQVSSRQAVTTIASRKVVKKEDVAINSIQPKKLFKDGEKSVLTVNKKPSRPGRVVASRYSQNTTSSMRKRSLPEDDKDDGKRCEKKRSLSVGKSRVNETESKNLGTESRVKKRWEIPSEIVVHGSENENSPQLLRRIRIGKVMNESPRDSGAAKRVVELIGKKSFFAIDEGVEPSVCQALSYAEEED